MVVKRVRRDMCKSHEPMSEIPFELVIEIFTRLPAKSLMKFKSVSKIWSSLICSRYFTNRFLRIASSPPPLYMILGFFDNSYLKSMVLSLSPSSDSESEGATMSSLDVDQDLTIPAMAVSGVFHGLMCFINGSSVQIYNTTTRQLVVLPDIKESKLIAEDQSMSIMCHVGHDPVHNQYKVVYIASRVTDEDTIMSDHWVFLLERDGSSRWKKISCGYPPHCLLTKALNINGRMHYLAEVSRDDVLIMIFDIHSEEFSVLQLPEGFIWPYIWPYIGLIECDGKIAFLNNYNLKDDGVIELWVVEVEETNMWGCKTLVLHPSQKHMVNSIALRVQGTTPNGEVILAPRDTKNFNIFLYDLQKNHMRKIKIKATPNRRLTKIDEVFGMDNVENLIHF